MHLMISLLNAHHCVDTQLKIFEVVSDNFKRRKYAKYPAIRSCDAATKFEEFGSETLAMASTCGAMDEEILDLSDPSCFLAQLGFQQRLSY